MKYFIPLLLLFTGCQNHQYGTWPSVWPSDLDQYLVDYIDDSYSLDSPTNINWLSQGKGSFEPEENLPKNIAGMCTWSRTLDGSDNPNNWWTIEINADLWVRLTEPQRLNLIYHELAHCLHLMPHREDEFDNGQPVSFMYPRVLSDYYIRGYEDSYVYELFKYVWPE